jgi:hypothetical protein
MSGAARLRLASKFPAPSTGPGKLRRNGGPCVRQNRVVLTVVATVKPFADAAVASTGAMPATFARAREARTNSAPGRARHKPSGHCAGKAVCWASPVCRCAVLLRYLRTADRGCEPAPGLPCALCLKRGRKMKQSSGEMRREDAKPCQRFGMRTGGATLLPQTPSLRGVKRRSNPEFFRGGILDCFAALAMTVWREWASYSALVPRTQRSVTSTVHCRAGAHVSVARRMGRAQRNPSPALPEGA